MYAFGHGDDGKIGNGFSRHEPEPTRVICEELEKKYIVDIAASYYNVIYLTSLFFSEMN